MIRRAHTLNSLAMMTTMCGVLNLAGCGGNGAETSPSPSAAQLPDVNVQVPSQDQADADAVKTINPENADEEFERLQREIDADSGG